MMTRFSSVLTRSIVRPHDALAFRYKRGFDFGEEGEEGVVLGDGEGDALGVVSAESCAMLTAGRVEGGGRERKGRGRGKGKGKGEGKR